MQITSGQLSRKSKQSLSDLMGLVGVVLLCHGALVAARPLPGHSNSDERDPMVAMPSGQPSQADTQEVHYVAYQPAGAYAMGAQPEVVLEAGVSQTQPSQVRFITEIGPEQYEIVQPSGAAQIEEANCKQREKHSATQDRESEESAAQSGDEPNSGPDYASQIVYVSQNGNEADQLKDAAASWSQASDLSATILTEVPIKEMSPEVLSKLRRDYGVKVVATRERPGANLVINCEEYSGTESSICGRQPAPSQELAYELQHVQRVQIESGEAMAMEPRRRISNYHQTEQFVQSAGQHMPDTQSEGYHAGSRAGETGARDVGEGEQVVYEAAPARPSGAYESAASHEATRETQPLADGPSGAAQEAPDSYGQRSQADAPAAGSLERGETQENPAGFGEQQQGEPEGGWQQGSAERTIRSKASARAIEWPDHAGAKQVAPGESDAGETRTRS